MAKTTYYGLYINNPLSTEAPSSPAFATAWDTDLNFELIDIALHTISQQGSGGTSIQVNGATVASPNFNSASPTPPAGYTNVIWQVNGSAVSAYAAASTASVSLPVDSGTPQVIAVGDLVCWGGNGQYGNGDGLIPADNSNGILGVALTSGGASTTITVQISGIATVNATAMVEGELVNATDPNNLGFATNSDLGDTINDQYLAGISISGVTGGKASILLVLCSAPPTPAPYFLKTYQAQGTIVAGNVVSMVPLTSNVVQACTSTMIPLGIAVSVTRFGVTTCIGGVSPINAVMTGAAIMPGDFLAVNDSSEVILAQPAPGQTIRTIGISVDSDSAHPGTTDQHIVYVIPTSVTGDCSADLFSNPMTTDGDMIYENASLGAARLPIGTSGQFLIVAGGIPAWTTFPTALPNGTTATEQAAGSADSRVATDSYVDRAAATALTTAEAYAFAQASAALALAESSAASLYIPLSVMTTDGDMLYESPSLGPKRLPIGTTGQILSVAGGIPTWESVAALAGATIALSDSTGLFNVTGSPATLGSGLTLATYKSQAQNAFLAGPSTGGAGAASFRLIAVADVPTLNQNTSGTAANLSGTPALPNGTTATEQAAGSADSKVATDSYVDRAAATTLTTAEAYAFAQAASALALAESSASSLYIPLSTMTTDGDMIYESPSLGPVRLPIGATGQFLGVSGGIPAWGTVLWSQLGNAAGALTLSNGGNASTFNQTSAAAWTWANTTPAVAGATNTVALSTSVAPTHLSGNSWVYTLAASESGAGSNGWAGALVTINGYTGGATGNNGTNLLITASTTTTVTITNATGTVTNTGAPAMASTVPTASPAITLSTQVNTGTAGTLNSVADTWTIQSTFANTAPNAVPQLVLSHTDGSSTGGQVIFPPGSNANPGISSSNTPSCGFVLNASSYYASAGAYSIGFLNTGLITASGNILGWSSSTNPAAAGFDTGFSRLAAGVIVAGTGAAASAAGVVLANGGLGVLLKSTASITGPVPVKADTSNADQVVSTTTADTGAGIVLGVCINSPAAGANAQVVTSGIVPMVLGTGTIAIGNNVVVDTTTNGRVKAGGAYTAGTIIGVAMAAQSSVGSTFNVFVDPK